MMETFGYGEDEDEIVTFNPRQWAVIYGQSHAALMLRAAMMIEPYDLSGLDVDMLRRVQEDAFVKASACMRQYVQVSAELLNRRQPGYDFESPHSLAGVADRIRKIEAGW